MLIRKVQVQLPQITALTDLIAVNTTGGESTTNESAQSLKVFPFAAVGLNLLPGVVR